MKPIRELLDDATCEAIDRWRADAPIGSLRSATISFNARFPGLAVSLDLCEQDPVTHAVLRRGSDYGPTARDAFRRALEEFGDYVMRCTPVAGCTGAASTGEAAAE